MTKSRNNRAKGKDVAKAKANATTKGIKSKSRGGTEKANEIEAWWSTDSVDNSDVRTIRLKGAAAIAVRFMKVFQRMTIDLERTRGILRSYRQFLAVKQEHEDWDGKKLSPCYLISKMWDLHSQMIDYESDMKMLCGHAIKYRGRGDNNEIDLESRERATIEAIQKRFGNDKLEESVWNVILIGIDRMDRAGSTIVIYGGKTTPLSEIIEAWAEEEKVALADFNFFYKKERINGSDTHATIGMTWGINIEAVPIDLFVIIVNDMHIRDERSGEDRSLKEISYCLHPEDMLSWLMDNYAERNGVEKSSLVFTFKGKMIFGHEHPREFNMGHFDIIDVVPVALYKYDQCICCNPKSQFKVGLERRLS